MLFNRDRSEMRRFYLTAWRKYRANQPLEPLEAAIAEVVVQHPEYHPLLNSEAAVEREWGPEQGESNPFLHMGMHLGLREQLATDRPPGIAGLHRAALLRYGDPHAVEHRMMECLAEALWTAQQRGTAPDERAYLACLEQI